METKIAIVTGASRGIGFAIAQALAEAGYVTAMCGRDLNAIKDASHILTNAGLHVKAYQCDVGRSREVSALREMIAADLGDISVLVNNAGSAPSAKLEATTDEMWRETMAVNLDGPFFMSRAFVPDMRRLGGGQIINIASTAALMGFRYNSAYTASKHGVLGLTRALAAELASSKIFVNAICPGFVRTRIVQESVVNIVERTGMSADAATSTLANMNREGRLIEPEEIATTVLKLARSTEEVSGRAFHADGTMIEEINY